MTKKKYTSKQVKKMESELFSRRTSNKRYNELKRILRGYGWS